MAFFYILLENGGNQGNTQYTPVSAILAKKA